MNNKVEFYEIEQLPEFEKEVNKFVKKKHFGNLPNQIMELAEQLEKGDFEGTLLTHCDSPTYDVYKKRLPNLDTKQGKSNGYRVIYMAEHNHKIIVLLSVYYKKEQENVSEAYISGLIDGYFAEK